MAPTKASTAAKKLELKLELERVAQMEKETLISTRTKSKTLFFKSSWEKLAPFCEEYTETTHKNP